MRSQGVRVDDAWIRPAPMGANGAGYLTITNRGASPDALVSIDTPAAARASIHESRLIGQVMTMRALTALPIPAGKSVVLHPGGLHLMFEALKARLTPGQVVPATLIFARAGSVKVVFRVAEGPRARSTPGMAM